MPTLTQTYAYRGASTLSSEGELRLATSGAVTPDGWSGEARFFAGALRYPQEAAAALLAVADVAAADYRRRRSGLLDPVVTGHGDRLRFESFSACGGVYAQLEVLAGGLDGVTGYGTTNVDVNLPLRDALSAVRPGEALHLRVGPEELEVRAAASREPVVERKVALPERWVRGFGEVQAVLAGFDERARVPAAAAVRFLRSLPRGGSGPAQWAVAAGGALRLTSRPVPGAVCLPGPERLGALTRVLRFARALTLYGPPPAPGGEPQAGAWEVELPGMRLLLVLSPDNARGFSGEGANLQGMLPAEEERDAVAVGECLAWQARIDVRELARRCGLTEERVRAALAVLAGAGRIGYCPAEAGYFHRELPFDAEAVERCNPRLGGARALVAEGRVRLTAWDGAEGSATVDDGRQHVRRTRAGWSCTCEWWARYGGGRGPCKHVLGVQLALRGRESVGGTVRTGAGA
ncbi:SWIM zinc finger family protein [Streptomyces sp. NPDC021224]|uniref:SWIM zinc finger family protein n=1 Tax=unclassified Streptomyces TaxID=2593676 RepID=UPI0037A79072